MTMEGIKNDGEALKDDGRHKRVMERRNEAGTKWRWKCAKER